jgi:hypothetical protein
MTIIGGLRARYIKQALFDRVNDNLDLLGWLDSADSRRDVIVIDEALDHDEEALPNIVAVSFGDKTSREYEMGSLDSEHITNAYVDVYAESNSLGLHLSQDIVDILYGRFISIGQSGHPRFQVLEYGAATPSAFTTVELIEIRSDKGPKYNKPFLKHWWQISMSVEDYYSLDN